MATLKEIIQILCNFIPSLLTKALKIVTAFIPNENKLFLSLLLRILYNYNIVLIFNKYEIVIKKIKTLLYMN